jgi:hypothetical protein
MLMDADKKYPTGFRSDEIHLLFDLGYAYALLMRAQHVMEILLADYPECTQLVADIKEFKEGRLKITAEIYAAAARIFKEVNERR